MKKVILGVLVVALAGCGSWMHRADDTPAYPAGTTIVTISGNQFAPSNVTVRAGNAVYFKNADTTSHRIMLDDRRFDTSDIAPGALGCGVILNEAGTYSYHDVNMPSMTGTITVTQ
jgi:plastocyanin